MIYTRRPLRHCTLDLTGEYIYNLNYRIIVQLLFLFVTKSLDYVLVTIARIGTRASASSVLCKYRPEGSSRIFCSFFIFFFPHLCLMIRGYAYTLKNGSVSLTTQGSLNMNFLVSFSLWVGDWQMCDLKPDLLV